MGLFLSAILAVIIIFFVCFMTGSLKEAKERAKTTDAKNKYFDQLLELQKLKEKNILTEAEFEREKAKIKPTE